jgi:hypothetical protein
LRFPWRCGPSWGGRRALSCFCLACRCRPRLFRPAGTAWRLRQPGEVFGVNRRFPPLGCRRSLPGGSPSALGNVLDTPCSGRPCRPCRLAGSLGCRPLAEPRAGLRSGGRQGKAGEAGSRNVLPRQSRSGRRKGNTAPCRPAGLPPSGRGRGRGRRQGRRQHDFGPDFSPLAPRQGVQHPLKLGEECRHQVGVFARVRHQLRPNQLSRICAAASSSGPRST